MFAHQVIEDILEMYKFYQEETDLSKKCYVQYCYGLIKGIKNSQQFHLSNMEGLLESCKSMRGKPIFIGDNGSVRLPYKQMWLDYEKKFIEDDVPEEMLSTKRGIFATELAKDLMALSFFAFANKIKKWTVEPLMYFVSIDKPICEQPEMIDMIKTMCDSVNRSYTTVKGLSNILPLPLIPSIDIDTIKKIMKEDIDEFSALNTTLMLLSCKNICTEVVQVSGNLNKKRIKSGKLPLFSYRILTIKPTSQYDKSIPKHIWENRIHLCRGHFKSYTQEHPLFGHLTGRYWWQAQARGNKKLGVVMKDYELKKVA